MFEGRYYFPHCTDKIDRQRGYIIYPKLYRKLVCGGGINSFHETLKMKFPFPQSCAVIKWIAQLQPQ